MAKFVKRNFNPFKIAYFYETIYIILDNFRIEIAPVGKAYLFIFQSILKSTKYNHSRRKFSTRKER